MKREKEIYVITDLQFGSTGKGLLAGYLAKRKKPDTVMTAWAPNAGHTFIDSGGRKYVHCMLANGVISPNLERLMIGPGSVIDPDLLLNEIHSIWPDGNTPFKIFIHPNAAICTQKHRDEEERTMQKNGSTRKGTGAAMIQRILRDPMNNNAAYLAMRGHVLGSHVCSHVEYAKAFDQARVVQIEGAQGYSLSMYHGFYPYTTSRDVSTFQILADCGVPCQGFVHVYGVARTYPIRVNHRGGYSGPGYPDQSEITFEDIGQPVELTTVTKLPRRIFTFSTQQICEAVRQNGVHDIFLNFANYCKTMEDLDNLIDSMMDSIDEYAPGNTRVSLIGMGPSENDVLDITMRDNWNKLCASWP